MSGSSLTPFWSGSPDAEFLDVQPPVAAAARLSNRDLIAGPPISELQRVSLYSDKEFELFVEEWAYGTLRNRYARVQHASGSGDKGRDVLGFVESDVICSAYDLYQCKQYGHPLQPSDIWVELGKVCVYTHRRVYRLPRRYYLVSPHGIGPKLQQLLQEPDRLKQELVNNWSAKCEKEITKNEAILLKDDLLEYVSKLDFSIFDSVEPTMLIEDLRGTPYFTRRFGGLQRRRPDPPTPPEEIAKTEARYVEQLLEAYTDYKKAPVPSVAAISAHAQLRSHFARQREAFYRAESLREFERDALGGDDTGFVALMDEICRGVIDVCFAEHESGFHRVNAVTGEARRLQPTDYVLSSEMHIEDRAGICHHLANEDRLQWVP